MLLENGKVNGFRIARNPSHARSVLLGLKFGLWLAPTTLVMAIGRPLKDAALGLAYATARAVAWFALCLLLIGAGAMGFVVASEINQD